MANPHRLRCPECRTRRTDPHAMVLHVLACERPLCNCDGYPYAHRPMGGECRLNPDAQMRLALQHKLPEDDPLDVAAEVAFSIPGKPMKAWPFDGVPRMKESTIEAHLVKCVKARGGEVRKVQWIGRRGAPDRLVLLPHDGRYHGYWGPCIWVELKAPGVKPEAHQVREHARMSAMGQRVVVIDSIEAVEELLA